MSRSTLAALLLAGGASRRMGSPKATLDFGGRPLWRAQLEKLEALAPTELFISVPPTLLLPGGNWKILHDEKPDLGPLAGLSAARRAMSSDWLIVLAIDLPSMTANYLQQLCDHAFECGTGQVPQMDGHYLGLSAIYSRTFLQVVERHLGTEDRSLQLLVRDGVADKMLTPRMVPESERQLFLNTNFPDEYAAAFPKSSPSGTRKPAPL